MSSEWSSEDQAILKKYLTPFRSATGDKRSSQRTQIVIKAYAQLLKRRPNLSPEDDLALKKEIRRYYTNHGRTRESKDKIRLQNAYNYRSVIMFWYKDEVESEVERLQQGAARGSTEWISCYQPAVSAVIKTLSPEQVDDAKAEAKRWTAQKPPPDVQARQARLKAAKYTGQWADQMFRQLGMFPVIFTHHKDEAGEVQFMSWEYGKEVCGVSMADAMPDWQERPPMEGLMQHAEQLYGSKSGDSVTGEMGAKSKRATKVCLRFRDGFPLLPPIKTLDDLREKDLPWLKGLIRAYVHAAFCYAKGMHVKHAPWGAIESFQRDLIDAKCLNPDETIEKYENGELDATSAEFIILREPSKMSDDTVRRLLEHWYKRDLDPLCQFPFCFKAFVNKKQIHPAINKPVSGLLEDESDDEPAVAKKHETAKPNKVKVQKPGPTCRPKSKQVKQKDVEANPDDGSDTNRNLAADPEFDFDLDDTQSNDSDEPDITSVSRSYSRLPISSKICEEPSKPPNKRVKAKQGRVGNSKEVVHRATESNVLTDTVQDSSRTLALQRKTSLRSAGKKPDCVPETPVRRIRRVSIKNTPEIKIFGRDSVISDLPTSSPPSSPTKPKRTGRPTPRLVTSKNAQKSPYDDNVDELQVRRNRTAELQRHRGSRAA